MLVASTTKVDEDITGVDGIDVSTHLRRIAMIRPCRLQSTSPGVQQPRIVVVRACTHVLEQVHAATSLICTARFSYRVLRGRCDKKHTYLEVAATTKVDDDETGVDDIDLSTSKFVIRMKRLFRFVKHVAERPARTSAVG